MLSCLQCKHRVPLCRSLIYGSWYNGWLSRESTGMLYVGGKLMSFCVSPAKAFSFASCWRWQIIGKLNCVPHFHPLTSRKSNLRLPKKFKYSYHKAKLSSNVATICCCAQGPQNPQPPQKMYDVRRFVIRKQIAPNLFIRRSFNLSGLNGTTYFSGFSPHPRGGVFPLAHHYQIPARRRRGNVPKMPAITTSSSPDVPSKTDCLISSPFNNV